MAVGGLAASDHSDRNSGVYGPSGHKGMDGPLWVLR